MDRRALLALLVVLVAQGPLSLVGSLDAYADDDDSDDDSGGDDSGGDDSDDDDDEQDDDDDGGHGGSDDHSGKGRGGDDQDEALRAVRSEDALTLRQILALFARQSDGKVIDVDLVRRQEALIYRVKFIDTDGRVKRIEFDALSGTRLR